QLSGLVLVGCSACRERSLSGEVLVRYPQYSRWGRCLWGRVFPRSPSVDEFIYSHRCSMQLMSCNPDSSSGPNARVNRASSDPNALTVSNLCRVLPMSPGAAEDI